MRVLPTAPVLFLRRVAEDTTLGGNPLPKDANVVVSPLAAHHDPTFFPSPRTFDPDRWLSVDPPPYAYFPFGAGPRTCAGALFASQSIRLVLSMILKRFALRTIAGATIDRLTRGNILHPKAGLSMTIAPAGEPLAPPLPVSGNIGELVALL
jgi:cytochrome P450